MHILVDHAVEHAAHAVEIDFTEFRERRGGDGEDAGVGSGHGAWLLRNGGGSAVEEDFGIRQNLQAPHIGPFFFIHVCKECDFITEFEYFEG